MDGAPTVVRSQLHTTLIRIPVVAPAGLGLRRALGLPLRHWELRYDRE